MRRSGVIGHVGLVALVVGLVPLTQAGAGPAPSSSGATPDTVCRAAFGERGPVNGPLVGEGPSGDPMSVTVAWDPGEWPSGLREIVTCLSVGGHAVPALASTTVGPPNAGSVTVNFTLPAGDPGTLVCQESVLIGTGGTEGRSRPTNPVCFKLRAADDAAPTSGPGRPASSGPTSPARRNATPPAVVPPMTPAAPAPPARIRRGPQPPAAHRLVGPPAPATHRALPPATAPTELARRFPMSLLLGPGETAGLAAPTTAPPARAAVHEASVPVRPSATARLGTGRSSTRPAPARVGSAFGARAFTSDGRPLRVAPAPALPATGGAPVSALARTGINNHIPLAGGGGLLAIGGAAIVLGEPRRRSRRLRRA